MAQNRLKFSRHHGTGASLLEYTFLASIVVFGSVASLQSLGWQISSVFIALSHTVAIKVPVR